MNNKLEFFQDKDCTIVLQDLGETESGESKKINFYVKNIGDTRLRQIELKVSFPNVTNIEINFPSTMNPGEVVPGSLTWHPPNHTEGEVNGNLTIVARSIGKI